MFFVLSLLALLIALAVYYVRYQYSYWQRRNFPYDPDYKIPFGCLESVSKHEKSMGMAIHDAYLRSKERFVGIYLLFRPGLLVRDVTLARHVLAQDFASFHDRGVYVDEEKNPLSATLFAMRGQSWRSMRVKLAPSFTSGKLKSMFGTTEDISDKMIEHMKTKIPEGAASTEVDLKEIIGTYATDIIASVIFGLDINSYADPENKFRSVLTKVRKNTFFTAVLGMLAFLCPPVVKFMFRMGFKSKIPYILRDIIKDTIEYREKNNIVRKDMLQLLMQLRNTGKINEDDNNWNAQSTTGEKDLTKHLSYEIISAQGFIFYIAGQETTASTAALTIFEIAQYPELLARLNQEVEETLAKHDGKITYESLQSMEFLELCILETIRKYPGLPMLNRECTQDYKIPGTDKVIEKGTPIVISLFGIHRDPDNFPDPDKYDPERFLESNRNYNPNAYMPFGEGPRHCIAQRMGKVNAKLAVVKIMQMFNIKTMSRREIEIDNFSVAIVAKGGVKVKLSRKTAN